MRSILRKSAIGVAVAASALLVNPFNLADAAPGDTPRAQFRQCVNANQQARVQATNNLRQAVRAARNLPADQQQAAVVAARQAFQTAAEQARTAFNTCIDAIDTGN